MVDHSADLKNFITHGWGRTIQAEEEEGTGISHTVGWCKHGRKHGNVQTLQGSKLHERFKSGWYLEGVFDKLNVVDELKYKFLDFFEETYKEREKELAEEVLKAQ